MPRLNVFHSLPNALVSLCVLQIVTWVTERGSIGSTTTPILLLERGSKTDPSPEERET